MKSIMWAAVAVTALFVLMNAGAVFQPGTNTPYRVIGAVMAVAGATAAFGLALGLSWGRAAVVVVAAVNAAIAVVGLFTDVEGAVIGLVVGGLGVVLGALAGTPARQPAEA